MKRVKGKTDALSRMRENRFHQTRYNERGESEAWCGTDFRSVGWRDRERERVSEEMVQGLLRRKNYSNRESKKRSPAPSSTA